MLFVNYIGRQLGDVKDIYISSRPQLIHFIFQCQFLWIVVWFLVVKQWNVFRVNCIKYHSSSSHLSFWLAYTRVSCMNCQATFWFYYFSYLGLASAVSAKDLSFCRLSFSLHIQLTSCPMDLLSRCRTPHLADQLSYGFTLSVPYSTSSWPAVLWIYSLGAVLHI